MYYYANEFNYYKINEGKRTYHRYVACKLHKSKEEAENNAWDEWLKLANDGEILENTYVKTMWL